MVSLKGNYSKHQDYIFFILLVGIYSLTSHYMNEFILTREVYQSTYLPILSINRSEEIINKQFNLRKYVFIIIPILQILKYCFISSFIFSAFFIFDLNSSFGKVFKSVMYADIVFAIQSFLKPIYYTFFHKVNELKDLREYAPLSLYQIFNKKEMPEVLVYILQLSNLFEIAFIFLCARHLTKLNDKIDFKLNLKITLIGYSTFLILFMALVSFYVVTILN